MAQTFESDGKVVAAVLEAEGFILARQSDVLPRQHILIFQPTSGGRPSGE